MCMKFVRGFNQDKTIKVLSLRLSIEVINYHQSVIRLKDIIHYFGAFKFLKEYEIPLKVMQKRVARNIFSETKENPNEKSFHLAAEPTLRKTR